MLSVHKLQDDERNQRNGVVEEVVFEVVDYDQLMVLFVFLLEGISRHHEEVHDYFKGEEH